MVLCVMQETSLPTTSGENDSLAEHKLEGRTRGGPYNCQVACSRPEKMRIILMLGMFREGFLGGGTWLGPSGVAMWTLGRPGGQWKCLCLQSRSMDRGSLISVNSHHKKHVDIHQRPLPFVQPFRYLPKFAKAPSLA